MTSHRVPAAEAASPPITGAAPGPGRAAGRAALPRVPHGVGFWFASVAFAVLMAFGTAPTPLWPLYEARDGFGATTVTVAFGVLVVGSSIGFVALGHLSDRFGRRRIVVPALGVAIVSALVLAFWTNLAGLLTGRFLNGIGIGLMASTATAYLHDLYAQRHQGRPDSALPGIVATVANLGGLALGPLVAGAVAQWAPSPLTATQVGFAAAMAACLAMALSTPETVDFAQRSAQRPPRFALRPDAGAVFRPAASLGFFAFALLGLVTSLGAIMLRTELGVASAFTAGLASFLMYASSAVAQLVLSGLRPQRMTAVGAVVFPVGLGLVTLSLYEPVLWLFLVAVTVAGAGAGVLFKAGLARAAGSAVPPSRAGVLAVYFATAYVGMGLPAILFSLVIKQVSVGEAMIGFSLVLSAGAVLSTVAVHRAGARAGDGRTAVASSIS